MQHPPPSVPGSGTKKAKPVSLVSVKQATLAPQLAPPVQPMLIIVPPSKKVRTDVSFHRKARKLKVVSDTE